MAYGATLTATIPINTTTSDIKDLGGNVLAGFITPAALTGTAFTFNVAPNTDPTTPTNLYLSSGSALSFTVAASRYVAFSQDQLSYFRGVRFVQIVSGSSEAAARSIVLVTVPLK